jgi:hypothetical protein
MYGETDPLSSGHHVCTVEFHDVGLIGSRKLLDPLIKQLPSFDEGRGQTACSGTMAKQPASVVQHALRE